MIKPRSVILYGDSGTGKTSNAYFLIKWILSKPENKGKHFRVVHSDGGGWAPFEDSGMIERREIDLYDYSAIKVGALSRFKWLGEGYWPRLTIQGETFFQKTEECKTKKEEWDTIAGYLIEGIESTCEVLKHHCSNQTEGVGFKETWRYEEDGETILGLQQGHYGIIQKLFVDAHRQGFNCLPTKWLIYTTKLGAGEDKFKKERAFGPQIVGNALTPTAPGLFMDVLHLDVAKYTDKKGEPIQGLVAWFTRHYDEAGIPFLCKSRCMPELVPKLLEYFPYGFVPLGFKHGVDKYFAVLEKLRKESLSAT